MKFYKRAKINLLIGYFEIAAISWQVKDLQARSKELRKALNALTVSRIDFLIDELVNQRMTFMAGVMQWLSEENINGLKKKRNLR